MRERPDRSQNQKDQSPLLAAPQRDPRGQAVAVHRSDRASLEVALPRGF